MASVVWTLQALDDIDAICLFIARDNRRVASVFARRAFEATEHLEDFPRAGRRVPEFKRDEIREVFLFSYRIIYRHRGELVEVLTVHHGARLLTKIDTDE